MTEDLHLNDEHKNEKIHKHSTLQVSEMYENWFLDYATYVILERAIPEVIDGLKPVQRRILHTMDEMEDGRYNKVANIIGQTMKYHPHGDASIGDALVQLGQRELLIDTQGNWGNIITGDSAAAPRYIEARLTPFAKEVVFNHKTTEWIPSYDGRNNEPVKLPVKFPLLLAQGIEGIAVGLACKIMPHNFIELIDASLAYLKDEEFELYPDFPNGGKADFSKYNDGLRGGRIISRAKLSKIDNKTIAITEIPFGRTTETIINSIVAANDKGKIKIKKIDDNTAEKAEIIVHLAAGVSPDKTIDALYAFTDCQISISPNSCVIYKNKPVFMGVSEVLKISTDNTVELLKKELEIKQAELMEQLLYLSLERIFIENKIYRKIEECKTWEAVIETIDKGLEPYKADFYREITQDDIVWLTELKIKKISKYDLNRVEERMKVMLDNLEEVRKNLAALIPYAIKYFEKIKEKYGAGKERKTEIENIDSIDVVKVAATSSKLYFDSEEGFAGIGLKKAEYVCDCSNIDDIIYIRRDGTYQISKVSDKFFVGKDVIYINVFRKNDNRTIYNCVYQDGPNGAYYVKRFPIVGITRDKEYDITNGKPNSKIIYLNVRPNGEAETIKVSLRPKPKLRNLNFEYDFKDLAIKGKNSKGNILTKHGIKKIQIKDEGVSTLGALKVWFDESVKRLNTEGRGVYIGGFEGDDKIMCVFPDGTFRVTNFDVTNHFDDIPIYIKKHHPLRIYSVIYYSGEKEKTYVKRFQQENVEIFGSLLDGHSESRLLNFFYEDHPRIALVYPENKKVPHYYEMVELDTFIEPKGYTAKGKRLTEKDFDEILILKPYYPDRAIFDEETVSEKQEEIENEETSENGEETLDNVDNKGNDKIENNENLTSNIIPNSDNDDEGDNFQLSLF
ncbi:DNA gyrase/topoisomerase IV subunit A [Odoribacter sp. OttesenSCG-928-L07]|nr:DNA gyrase/topoisomerase IV subunit A [Odoribacter sp. OttesenSCG-928-L07]MDL2239205.1 DNA gyrase/topoisomerase IV subunit A [Bacteroidales bacterium OttesenSCG-928-L14]MDL2240549.1 DNA gyrase/topoisomerase IV subunit A [Bacteroidales bacterium OttesenSCG-928-K22]